VRQPRLKVSAIMPVHNGMRHCVGALESVLGQSEPPDQVIIVDDGSTDGSARVIEDALAAANRAPHEPSVKLVRQPNAGQSAARNHAADLATGDLLAFIDQDDIWHPEHLRLLSAPFASDPRLGWAFSDFDEIDLNGMVNTRSFCATVGIDSSRRSTLGSLLGGDIMVLPSASVLRAEAFHAVGGFDPELQGYEDDDLFIRFFRHGWASVMVPKSLTSFRTHSTSSSAGPRFQQSRVRFLDKLIATVPDEPRMNRFLMTDLVMPRLFNTTLTEYCVALRVGDDEAAAQLALTASQLSERSGPASLRRRIELELLRRPPVMRRFLSAYEALPRRVRPFIHPALSLRSPGLRP